MAIISDEIKDTQNMDLPRQVDVLYNYIKYLKEQIDFWASNRTKDIDTINGAIGVINDSISTIDDAIGVLDDAKANRSGDTFSGDIVIDDKGTTTSSKVSILTLGNSTKTGTVGNSNGMIRMYGQGNKYLNIRPTTTSGTYTTANRAIMFPDADGTVMLNTGGTFIGNVAINNSNGVANQDNLIAISLGNNVAKTSAGHSEGYIAFYGNTGKYTSINAFNSTANRTISFPDVSGTIMTDKGGTFIKPVVIDEHNGTTSSVGASHLTLGNSIASGTAGNSTASLTMYGRQSYYTALYTAETLTSNRSIYFPDAGGTIQLVEDHTYVTPSSWTTTIPSGTTTTVGTISLSTGIWIITGGFQFTDSFTQVAYIMLNGSDVATIVRGTGTNGGGLSLSHLEKVTSTKSVSLQAYQASGSSKTINRLEFRAVRISK